MFQGGLRVQRGLFRTIHNDGQLFVVGTLDLGGNQARSDLVEVRPVLSGPFRERFMTPMFS